MAKLTLDDIADQRAYERERTDFRTSVIALKKRRRIHVGPVLTLLFENSDTVRFQIQEMARAEKMFTDEAILAELEVYNPLVPEPGSLACTLFIEVTEDAAMREWLPKLVGIETHVTFRLGEGDDAQVVRCEVDADHQKQLTRDEITAAVHYLHFTFTPEQVDAFVAGPVSLVIDHPAYAEETVLSADNTAELMADLSG